MRLHEWNDDAVEWNDDAVELGEQMSVCVRSLLAELARSFGTLIRLLMRAPFPACPCSVAAAHGVCWACEETQRTNKRRRRVRIIGISS
jgi:hypothetical protein